MVLKKLADIEDSNKEQFLWLKSEREEIEVQGTKKKGKQRKQRLDEVEEEEEVGGQEEKNVIESIEVVFLWLHFLLKLELDRFFRQFLIFSMGRKWI